MIKQGISILFLLSSIFLLILHSIIPHNHINGFVESILSFNEILSTHHHHHEVPANNHHHHNQDESEDFCHLTQVILYRNTTSDQYFQLSVLFKKFYNTDVIFQFSDLIKIVRQNALKIIIPISKSPPLNRITASNTGLRAPPKA